MDRRERKKKQATSRPYSPQQMTPRADNLHYPLQQSKAADLKTQSSNGRVKINHREKSETKKSMCYHFSCIFLYAAATVFLETLVRLQKEKVSPTVKISIVPAINSGTYLHTCHFNKQTHAQGALPL